MKFSKSNNGQHRSPRCIQDTVKHLWCSFSVKILAIFTKIKKLRHRFLTWFSTYLRSHFHSLCILDKHPWWKFSGAVFGKIWANLSNIVPIFSKSFDRFTWESARWSLGRFLIQIWNCTHNDFLDRNVFHNTDFSCFKLIDLYGIFLLTLCDRFVNLSWL